VQVEIIYEHTLVIWLYVWYWCNIHRHMPRGWTARPH